jgi:RND family efflux transporter MFP subunit
MTQLRSQPRRLVSSSFVALVATAALAVGALAARPALAAGEEPQICYSRQDLAARAAGFVERVLARDGAVVRRGDVLVELDARLHKAAVREAQAAAAAAKAGVALAEDAHRRLQKLAASESVAQGELFAAQMKVEQARAGLAQAEAALERAKIALSDTQIKAAVDGKVSGLPQVKGLYVQAGQALGRIEVDASKCNAQL